jgi:hypothetical protein
VTLAPTVGTEFSGLTMPVGWVAVPWGAGGGATVGDGALFVDGARVGTCVGSVGSCTETSTLTPGHRLEFVATFNGDPFQHAGFGQTLENGQPFAIFSTDSGNTLLTRTLSNSGTASNNPVPLGSLYLGFPHLFAIDWKSDSVDYYIDGVLVVHDPVAVAGPMRPIAASDFNVLGGMVLVDWMRMTPYSAAGTFQSRVFDANGAVDWHTIQWTAKTPPERLSRSACALATRRRLTPAGPPGCRGRRPVP